ncbi:MAG: hypothetical protein ACPG3X_03860 [Opitutales bacterium]
MKKAASLWRILLATLLLASLAGCASTRTQNGVTIKKDRSLNPLDYIPDLPKLTF